MTEMLGMVSADEAAEGVDLLEKLAAAGIDIEAIIADNPIPVELLKALRARYADLTAPPTQVGVGD